MRDLIFLVCDQHLDPYYTSGKMLIKVFSWLSNTSCSVSSGEIPTGDAYAAL